MNPFEPWLVTYPETLVVDSRLIRGTVVERPWWRLERCTYQTDSADQRVDGDYRRKDGAALFGPDSDLISKFDAYDDAHPLVGGPHAPWAPRGWRP